ncbi:hypothetical protein ACFV1F_14560 [Streptomyces sp. NPDC059590]|uniref:hypothetical protein n=1 Tax=Streptomyces sp. NPDC059590 TaxID=3346877 RepID=UPI0036C25D8D
MDKATPFCLGGSPMTTRAEPWMPTSGRSVNLQPAGRAWDVVRVPVFIDIGKRVLDLLGEATGAVIENPIDRVLYWLIEPGAATSWDMSLLPSVQVWGTTAYIEVPPADFETGPGVRWLVPLRHDRYLTDPTVLLAALRTATREALGPREEVPQ